MWNVRVVTALLPRTPDVRVNDVNVSTMPNRVIGLQSDKFSVRIF